MNSVTLLGRLGRDPEIRSTNSSKRLANLSVATSERYKDRDGNQQERTEWHTVVVWGDRDAEMLGAARKGDEVFVQGRLQTRKWQDQSGQDRYSTEVVVQFPVGVVRLTRPTARAEGDRAQRQEGRGATSAGASWGAPPAARGSAPPADLDSDIPF